MKRAVLAVLIIALASIGVFFWLQSSKSAPEPTITSEAPAVASSTVNHTVIGRSVQNRAIDAYTYGNGPIHLLFVGGIHGGYEWNGVLLAYTFMDYLSAHPEIVPKNTTIAVIPDINPDAVYEVTGKEGRFAITDVSTSTGTLAKARFNADDVDLNRNFDCKWKPEGTWQNKIVSAGKAPFSEPETKTLRDYISAFKPQAAVFWHSQSNAVYASQCQNGIIPVTLDMMNVYAKAAGYPAIKVFGAYATTGAADDWLASIGVPAITVELKTHNTIEWDKNLAGIKALISYFNR